MGRDTSIYGSIRLISRHCRATCEVILFGGPTSEMVLFGESVTVLCYQMINQGTDHLVSQGAVRPRRHRLQAPFFSQKYY